jgi:Ran GTPase-activating protein (RanGAP) involved in mRNA processing and transport
VTLSKTLALNETLEELDVSHNGINWHGAFLLAKGLARNSTLKVLKVRCSWSRYRNTSLKTLKVR